MTDEQARVDASAEPTPAEHSPGQMLRAGRERQNLTTTQVAERLHLRHKVVADLEQDHYSKYVSSTFTRGYLRAYARLVEIDDEAVLDAYNALGLEEQAQPMQSFSRRTRQQSHDNKLMLVTYIIGALIIGSAVVFWLQNSQNGEANQEAPLNEPTPVPERLVQAQDTQVEIAPVEPVAVPTTQTSDELNSQPTELRDELSEQLGDVTREALGEKLDEELQPSQELSQEPSSEPSPEVDSELSQEPSQELSAAPAPSEATDSQPQAGLPDASLVLVFSGDAWIRIEDASGEAIAFGVKTDGHVSALDGQPPYNISLGAPENVTLYYQGEQIDLSSYRAGRLARITIPNPEF